MLFRLQTIRLLKSSSLGISVSLLLIWTSSVCAEDFRLLLVRDGGVDKTSRLPVGKVIVKAGYLDGIDEGMTGTIWRKNKFKGQIDIADIEVETVTAYEATCTYTVRHPDFYLLKKDRATMEPVEHADADILARAVGALGDGACFDALLYFESIFCATLENAFVQQQITECRRRVDSQLATAPDEAEVAKARAQVYDFLELAERHHKYKNDLAADLYLKRIHAIDAGNAKAGALRESVPVQDFSTLLSPARCDQVP